MAAGLLFLRRMLDTDSSLFAIFPVAALLLWALGTLSPSVLVSAADDLVALSRSPVAVNAMVDGLASELGPWSPSTAPDR